MQGSAPGSKDQGGCRHPTTALSERLPLLASAGPCARTSLLLHVEARARKSCCMRRLPTRWMSGANGSWRS